MNIFDKTLVQTAKHKKSKINLDCRHTTTSDFFQLNVPYIRRMIPDEKISVDVSAFSRLAGMPLPTFGDANLNLRAFFVPYRMIFKGWHDFMSDTPHVWSNGSNPSIPSNVPLIRNNAIVRWLAQDVASFRLGVYSSLTKKYGEILSGIGFSSVTGSDIEDSIHAFGYYRIYVPYIDIKYLRLYDINLEGTWLFNDGSIYAVDPSGVVHNSVGKYVYLDDGCISIIDWQTSDGIRVSSDSIDFSSILSDYNIGKISHLPWDFHYQDDLSSFSQSVGYRVLTSFGRPVYKILRQLGYAPYFDLTSESSAGMSHFSALELLALLKVWLDYYFPAQYYGSPLRTNLEKLINNDSPDVVISDAEVVNQIFTNVTLVSYASDFLTAAFDNPVGPDSQAASFAFITDKTIPEGPDIVADGDNSYTPTIQSYDADGTFGTGISQFALTALRKLTDFMKRHQLAGARAVDRILAQWGFKLDNNQINRCYYIGSHHVPMVIGDVMSTADTSGSDGAALGDYAGKGFLVGQNGHFEFDSGKDFGIFLICSSIIPNTALYQGYDIHTLKKQKLDFYTPEFDGLGTRAIEKGEVLATDSNISNYERIRGVFGFTPMYAEYKIPYNRLTGDFDSPSISQAGFTSDSWHLFRKIVASSSGYDDIVHSLNMVFGNDWEQYLRVFYNQTRSADHFVLNYLFNVTSYLPVKPLFDTYDFEHEDGQQIEMAVNGQRVN